MKSGLTVALAGALSLVIGAAAPASAATSSTGTDRALARALGQRFPAAGFGPGGGGVVVDVASGRMVWASAGTTGRMPASSAKLAVAVAALTVLGPEHTERTVTRYDRGTLYLVGGADQRLTRAALATLAGSTAAALRQRQLTVTALRIDDSLFPAPSSSPGWRPDYLPGEVAPVRALAFCGDRVNDTALAVGRLFARQLADAGVNVGAPVPVPAPPTAPAPPPLPTPLPVPTPPAPLRAAQPAAPVRAVAPPASVVLASHTSAPLAEAVSYMLKVSDNNIAEGLLRLTALARHRPATWQQGTATEREVLGGLRVPLGGVSLFDGSGLSRQDRITPAALTALAALAVDPRHSGYARLRSLLDGLPIAGRDGTLAARFHRFTTSPSSCAAGRVHAKTGTLHDVAALVGVTRGRDGRWKAFAFVENGPLPLRKARQGLDRLAATVTGCW